ncbi:hypothetical protein [Chryseobacterium sp. JUb7]|uniref:hypothetical protein n=1 Tax=Chryseobacterium sp. JUb7 TaxID=2940599 RepID=UPI0021690E96|nr:hypothetical protein [Chryseobacterium sp. JUb7]MCS3532847.1 transcriptional regulator with XRE-family HTH domain [Chryseobacterium sp. JUb7]
MKFGFFCYLKIYLIDIPQLNSVKILNTHLDYFFIFTDKKLTVPNYMQNITRENYSEILHDFIDKYNLNKKNISKVIGCSSATMERLLNGNILPSDEMLKQTGILITLGIEKYSKLTKTERENISELLGTLSGGGLGFATITAIVSELGFLGLSGAGIMSGLAVLGSAVGAGAAAGIVVAAAVPIAAGAAGYGIVKAVKAITRKYKNKSTFIDNKWEIAKVDFIPQ